MDEACWYPVAGEANNVWYVMPHIGERITLYMSSEEENAVAMTATRGTGGEMAKTKSMSKPTEKYMETKWNKKLALHEGDIELDIPTINVMLNENSITVTSNDKINIETKTDLNLGRTEFVQTIDGVEVVTIEETKNISIETTELLTLKIVKSDTTIELNENSDIHSIIYTSFMDGENKAPMALLSSKGQEAGEQATKAKAEAEAKAKAEAESEGRSRSQSEGRGRSGERKGRN